MDAVRIGTLRTQAAAREAPAVRSNLARLLASADLAAPGLPPQAVLIVRRLADPQPGRLAGRLQDVRVKAEWERGVRQRLAEVQRRAARPALGPPPVDAEAVLFADESELLACLARDIARSQARRWWWQTLLASGSTLRLASGDYLAALVKRLVDQARIAPAVLGRLAEWGEIIPVLRALTPTQAGAVLAATLKAYGLPDLSSGTPETIRPQGPPWAPPADGPQSIGGAAAAGLGREREALLGVALDLAARPQTVASQTYQRSLQAWWQSGGCAHAATPVAPQPDEGPADTGRPHLAERGDSASSRPTRSRERAADGPEVEAAGAGQTQRPVWEPGEPGPDRNADAERLDRVGVIGGPKAGNDAHAVLGGLTAGDGAHQVSETGAHLNTIEARGGPRANALAPANETGRSDAQASAGAASPTEQVELRQDSNPIAQAGVQTPPTTSLPDLLGEGVVTELGGVLYLINLMVALDLPDSFEAGWRLASGVGPWGLLEALGRPLLGEDPAAAGAAAAAGEDPLWLALAHLDGRTPGEPPGVRLPRSRPRRWPAFELPAAWVEGMPEAGELRGPRGRRPRPYTGHALGVRYRPLLARWLGLALPLIEFRLRLALGMGPAAAGGGPGVGELLRVPGRLYVSRTHVDLVASLEHISLPARLAGLDRNPGWLPDFGRVVYFHFE